MKKRTRNPNRQGFMNHVNTIRRIEADKDAFLKAARLERHESHSQPLTAKQKIILCVILAVAAVCCVVLALGYFYGNFTPALIAVGVIAFIAFIAAAGCS